MKRLMQTIGALAVTLAVAGNAQAVPLSDLLAGGSLTAGDKLFDQWTFVFSDASDDSFLVDPARIDVSPLNDGGDDPGPGLVFTIEPGALVVGDGVFSYTDYTFGFRVSVTDPGWAITGNTLALTAASLFHTVDGDNDLGVFIQEQVGTAAGLNDLAEKTVTFNILNDILESVVTDDATFAGQNQIFVTKNILVWAVDLEDSASLVSFEQRFSQSPTGIPEPASLLLLGMGLAGLGFARRRTG